MHRLALIVLLMLAGIPVASAYPVHGKAVYDDCEFLLIEILETGTSWGLTDACWAEEPQRLYLPGDSLSAKLGLPRQLSPTDLRSTATKLSYSSESDWLQFADPADPSRAFFDSQLLAEYLNAEMLFAFSAMRLEITSDPPFPRKLRLERLASVQRRLQSVSMDTLNALQIPSRKYVFHPGMFLWDVSGNQTYRTISDSLPRWENGYFGSLTYTSEILGGSFYINQPFRDNRPIRDEERTFNIEWEWDTPWIRNISIGHNRVQLFRGVPALSARITNRPTYPRAHIGLLEFSGLLEPGWDIELTRGEQLLNSAVAGNQDSPYHFRLPLLYGQNAFTASWYNETGLHRRETYSYYIPPRALPKGVFEYEISGGQLTVYDRNEAGHFRLGYGAGNRLSITSQGYTIRDKQGDFFTNASVGGVLADRTGNTLEGQYWLHGGHEIAFHRYGTGKNHLRARYAYMDVSQLENLFYGNSTRNADIVFDRRLRGRQFSGVFSFDVNWQETSPAEYLHSGARFQFTTRRWLASAEYRHSLFRNTADPFQVLMHRAQAQIQRSVGRYWSLVASSAMRTDRNEWQYWSFGTMYTRPNIAFTTSLRHDPQFNGMSVMATLRLQRKNATLGTLVQGTDAYIAHSTTLQGAMGWDPGYNRFFGDAVAIPGRGGVAVAVYADLNGNRIHDAGEPLLEGAQIEILNGGRKVPHRENDTITRFADLFPYQEHWLKITPPRNRPDLRPAAESVHFTAEPHRWKTIKIPMLTTTELMISLITSESTISPAALQIRLEPLHDGETYESTAFNDGTIYISQVLPGTYRLVWDEGQLELRGLRIPEITEIVVPAETFSEISIHLPKKLP